MPLPDPPRDLLGRRNECETLDDLLNHCFPAFGGAFLRRLYNILDDAVGAGCPLTLAIAGPVTVSGQHQAWLIPLLETGWVAYLIAAFVGAVVLLLIINLVTRGRAR